MQFEQKNFRCNRLQLVHSMDGEYPQTVTNQGL